MGDLYSSKLYVTRSYSSRCRFICILFFTSVFDNTRSDHSNTISDCYVDEKIVMVDFDRLLEGFNKRALEIYEDGKNIGFVKSIDINLSKEGLYSTKLEFYHNDGISLYYDQMIINSFDFEYLLNSSNELETLFIQVEDTIYEISDADKEVMFTIFARPSVISEFITDRWNDPLKIKDTNSVIDQLNEQLESIREF